MTTATIDPGVAVAAAVRELLDSLRELGERDTDNPAVLDEVSKLLSRARRKVNRARKTEESAPRAPQEPQPAPTDRETRSTCRGRQPGGCTGAGPVTVAIPGATPQRHETPREQPTTPPGVPMSTALTAPRPRQARQLIAGALLMALVILMVIVLAGCGTGTVNTGAVSDASGTQAPPAKTEPAKTPPTPAPGFTLPADMPPLNCKDFEPPPVKKPDVKFTARRCTDPNGSIRWINGFYPCTDGRIWPVLGKDQAPPVEPTSPEFDRCVGR